jgi:hypothetical protein
MSGLRQRRHRIALSTGLLAALLGCRAPPPLATAPARAAPPPLALPEADDSYDWHGLLIAPFGSALKDVPMVLHEVLLFRDEARSGAAADDAECYGADAPPPRFVGRTPDEYLLCFKQDRLSRIQASVRVTTAQASEVFSAACAGWLRRAAPGAPALPNTGTAGAACEGRDGAIRFSGRLGEETGGEETSETELALSITLDSVPIP